MNRDLSKNNTLASAILEQIRNPVSSSRVDLDKSDRGMSLELKQVEIADHQHEREIQDRQQERMHKDKREERITVAVLFVLTFIGSLYLAIKEITQYTTTAFSIAATFAGYFLAKRG